MNPKIWGHVMWSYLINLVLHYPDNFTAQHSHQFELLLGQLYYVLPCKSCRENYAKYFKFNPPNLTSKQSILIWLCSLYNNIGNKSYTLYEFVNKGADYNKKYFWDMLKYIIHDYPDSNSHVTYDIQMQYRQFFTYLFDMTPMRYIKLIPLNKFLFSRHTLEIWYVMMKENASQ